MRGGRSGDRASLYTTEGVAVAPLALSTTQLTLRMLLVALLLGALLQPAAAGGPVYCQPGQSPPQMCPCPLCAKLCPGIAPIFPCPLQCNPKPGLGCLCPTNVTQCNPTPVPPTACGLPVTGGPLKEMCPDGSLCPDSSTGGTCSFCPDIPTREEEEAAAAYMAAQQKQTEGARPGVAERMTELEALRSKLAALEREVATEAAAHVAE